MQVATVSEFRNNAKDYFDRVEKGETVQVFRNGKPVAVIAPYSMEGRFTKPDAAAAKQHWKNAAPIAGLKGVNLAKLVADERKGARF